MSFFSGLNRAWSGLDFWNKKENQRQRQQFATQDRKKRREDQSSAPTVASPQNNIPTPQTPFDFGSIRPHNPSVSVPHPGQPSKYGFWQKAGDFAGGITSGIAQVPLGVVRAGTGAIEAIDQLPALAVKGVNAVSNKATGNTGHWGVTDKLDRVTNAVNRNTLDPVNRGIDAASRLVSRVNPLGDPNINKREANIGYKGTQVGANIIAGATGVGEITGAVGASKAAQGTRAAPILSRFGRQLSPAEDVTHIISRVANPIAKISHGAINAPIRATRSLGNKITNLVGGSEDLSAPGQIANAVTPRTIPIIHNVPIRGGDTIGTPVNVRNLTGNNPLIREVGGDAATANEAAARVAQTERERLAAAANTASPARPDQRIGGVVTPPPKLLGQASGVTKIEVDTERAMLNDALANKEITKAQHKAANKALDQTPVSDAPPAKGKPITVKSVDSIPVTDQTVVPTGLPETPGTVRATTATAPANAKTAQVAAQTPPPLPKETQAVLDNPKQFNKRQVAAARNQARLAKQKAKADEGIAAAMEQSNAALPATPSDSPGFVPTGEFRRGENGNITQVAHGETEAAQAAQDTANLSHGDVLARATQDIAENGLVSPESVRNLHSMIDSGRFPQTSAEYKAMAKVLYGAGSDYGRGLSLFNPTLRRTASGDQLANRFISKLYGVAEDTGKLSDADVATVNQAENSFTTARDAANQTLDRYNATKSAEDFAVWKQAQQAADDAQKQSLITEYQVANRVLKGNKSPEALKAVQAAEKDAGVYQMDWIDANMLSGTGTATRNFINTALVRMENRLFGGRKYSSAGAKIGNKVGNRSVATDFKARNQLDQNIVSKSVKQWSTTANTLGEGNIRAVGTARAYKFYQKQLKAEGLTGDQLKRDTEVMLHTDPQKMVQHYEDWALKENALSGYAHSKKIEQSLVDMIAGHGGGKISQTSAKALVRLTVGFPTVIGRSLLGGVKRAGLGVPDLGMAGKAFAKGNKQELADALYNAKVHAGSGATLYALGTALAGAGIISPSYPSDPAEQARWKAEGTQPNSIRIAGQWFNIPGYFGALALPFTTPANLMAGEVTPKGIAKGVLDTVAGLSPLDSVQNMVDGLEGRAGKQWVKNEITSLTRAVTPVGSLLNQIAKMTDPTQNDTTTKDAIHNLLDSIASGIPGVNNAVNTIPKTDAQGNVLHNANPAAIALGAQGSVQAQGVEDVKQAQNTANDTYKQLDKYGVLKDKNLSELIDPKIQAQIKRGEPLTPEQVTKIQKDLTKSISSTGEDSVYLEKEQYDTNLATLRIKKDLMSADSTTKPSDLKKMDTAIKRGEVYKNDKISYEMIDAYKSTTLSDWRNMGDSESDSYDPEMYQKLWAIDEKMTKAGVSYKKDALNKNKFSAKEVKAKGKGSRGGSDNFSSEFGKLKAGDFAPSVQRYQTIDAKSGSIPHITVQRPNIVHKIGSSR